MAESFAVPSVMRALVLDGVGFGHLGVRTVPVPSPGPEELLARVDAAGICTSVIKLVEQGARHNQMYGWDVARFPVILGDEGAVTLVRVGAKLAGRFAPGERCVVQPAVDHVPINHRERYRDGGRGVVKVAVGYTLPGHLGEYMLITEETIAAGCVVPLPDGPLAAAHAAISEPVSCCISAQEHHVRVVQDDGSAPRRGVKGLRRGGVTVIIGAGVMGRMHIDVALAAGPGVVISTDLLPERLALVERLFADRARRSGVRLVTVNVKERELGGVVADATEGRGADDVIVAVGSRGAIESAQALCARGAVLNLFGGLKKGEDVVGLDTGVVHYREIVVTGSSGGAPWDIRRALELMATGEIETAAHITRVGDLGQAPDFLEMIRKQELDGKAVVYPHRRTDRILAVERWTADDERRYLAG